MQSTESAGFFRGIIDVDLTVVKPTSSDSNNNTEHTSSHPILVELQGEIAGALKIQEMNYSAKVSETKYQCKNSQHIFSFFYLLVVKIMQTSLKLFVFFLPCKAN